MTGWNDDRFNQLKHSIFVGIDAIQDLLSIKHEIESKLNFGSKLNVLHYMEP